MEEGFLPLLGHHLRHADNGNRSQETEQVAYQNQVVGDGGNAQIEQAHFQPRKLYYGGYLMRLKMVSEGKAAAITTQVGAVINAVPLDSIAIVPLRDPILTRTQAVCWAKERVLSPQEEEFVQFAVDYFKKNPLIDLDDPTLM